VGKQIDAKLSGLRFYPAPSGAKLSNRIGGSDRKLGLNLFNLGSRCGEQGPDGHFCVVGINYFPGIR